MPSKGNTTYNVYSHIVPVKTENHFIDTFYRFAKWWPSYKVIAYDPALCPFHIEENHIESNFYKDGKDYVRIELPTYMVNNGFTVNETSVKYTQESHNKHFCHKVKDKSQFRIQKLTIDGSKNKTINTLTFKDCDGKFYVHLFQSCEKTSDSTSVSPRDLPLYRCTNDQYVHYTVICNGYSDCSDNR